MSDATTLLNAANLALASFSTLAEGSTANQIDSLIEDAGARMSTTQALQFASLYPTIVTQFNDTTTGFSVMMFKDGAGNLTVAFRGVNDLGNL